MKKTVWSFISFLWITCATQAQILNVKTETHLDETYQEGTLTVQVHLAEQKYKGQYLQYKLINNKGKIVSENKQIIPKKQWNIKFKPTRLNKPRLWNAEFPNLYTLEVSLMKKDKTPVASQKSTVVFRHLKITGDTLRVNGQSVRIKGIHVRSLANLTTPNQQKKAIKEWKQHHVNAVYTTDIPTQTFIELCRKYGLYLLNETGDISPTQSLLQNSCQWNWPNHDLPVKMEEMKKLYQDIRFFDFNVQEGTISLQNLHAFTNLNQFDFYYIIRDHGQETYRNTLEGIQAGPGETFIYKGLKGIQLERKTTGDVRIEFYAMNRKNKPFMPKGSIMAREQTYIHTFYRPSKPITPLRTYLEKKTESDNNIIFQGKDLQLVFDKKSGMLTSYLYQGEEYLHQSQGLRPFFWRTPTQNNRLSHLPTILKPWKEASYQPVLATSFHCTEGQGTEIATIDVTYHYPQTQAQWDVNYKIYSDGTLKINNRFIAENKQAPIIPRVGLRMQLNSALTTFRYFGRGPRTNYRDCRTAQFLGEYTSAIQTTHEVCKQPQENSHRTDIYWCALTGQLKGGLLFVADRTFETNVTHLLLEDMEKGNQSPSQLVDLFIDFRMMGVGADNRPESSVQEPYLIRPGKDNVIEYGFTIIPFQQGEDYKKYILKY